MSDLDLAALTEAVYGRMLQSAHPDVSSLIRPSPLVVRAVLEALPREWGAEHGVSGVDWYESREDAMEGLDGPKCTSRCRLVWRAVGPPIPAEDQL